jgi:thioredoxin reductase (NADPH)
VPHRVGAGPFEPGDDAGFVMTGADLSDEAVRTFVRHPFALETSLSDVFAAGTSGTDP